MELDSLRASRESYPRTASAVWRFGEETLVSDPFSGGAFIAPPFFLCSWRFPRSAGPVHAPPSDRLHFSSPCPGIWQNRSPDSKKKSGRPVARSPRHFRHSEVLLFGSPGVRKGAQVNFSKNNKGISSIAQSYEDKFTTEYAAIYQLAPDSTKVAVRDKTFPHVRALSTPILRNMRRIDFWASIISRNESRLSFS